MRHDGEVGVLDHMDRRVECTMDFPARFDGRGKRKSVMPHRYRALMSRVLVGLLFSAW
jgi:cytoplasmic iron level regulating protein YaaA (DUF328/UPF0246 family)